MLLKSHGGTIPLSTNAFKVLSGTFILLSVFALSFIGIGVMDKPAPGVVMELRCNEGTGTTASDASGNAHNGTLTNGPTWGAGKYGQGINFDGSNDYVNLADHADYTLTPTVSYSWSAWVKNNNFNQWSTIWSQTLNSSTFFYFYAHTSTDAEAGPVTNGISVYWYNGTNKLVLHSNNNVLTTGQWSYVAVTYNASLSQSSRFTIYVNGVDVTNRSDVVSSGTIATIDPNNIRIGSNQPYGEYLNGSVDEVRYYRRLLSVSEIQSDMNVGNSQLPDTTPPTVNITAPAAGNVSGSINVTANASDNVGVAGVQFLLNGANLGTEDLASPYSVSWNTTTVANGTYTLTARARDAAGNTTTSSGVIVTVNNPDIQAPAVNITAPAAGNVSGSINVTANASDNVGVVGVQFLLNGANLGTEDLASPYSVSWNTTTVANGTYTLTARARDAAGNTTTSAGVIVTVNNPDIQAPTVSITAPAAGTVSGTINVNANASDNVGVVGVQFLLNGANLGTEDLASPYSVSWNTTTVTNGTYTLTARARDAAGNTTTSAGVIVTVNNPDIQAPTVNITAPAAGNISGTINVNANASDNVGVVGVQFLLNGANLGTEDLASPYSVSWNTTTVANGTYTLTARARDAAGNTTTSAGVIVTVNNDTQAPTVNITAPAAGNVSGTISVDANASDNVGVTGVQFLLNGANLGTEDVASPYSVSWNTTTVANGTYTLTARARDAAGNTTTSAGVIVTINNDTQAPTVDITAPEAGEVNGTINIDANASDNVGVVGVQYLLNGANLGAEDIASPYSISWNTTTVANGTYTLTARARDAAGNTTTSAGVIVTVNNPDIQAPTVNISAPAGGNVSGTINVNANASDNVGVTGVQFLLNGANLGTEDVASPYSVSWNTTTVTNGTYTLTAIARDAAGNTTTSADVVVTVNNDLTAPSVNITAPPAGNVSGTINVTANASDNVGVVGVQFMIDGNNLGTEDVASPYSVSWNTTTVTNGTYTLTAIARDAAGNTTTSADVVITVNNDLTAPTVNITAPAAGNVSGTISVNANANDNVSVAGVQFLLNGANLGAEDLASPYSISWNTTTVTNGSYTLTARARDAAGNTTTSAGVIVTVNNDTQAPTVNITAPAAGNVLGTINVNANASDNVSVVGVQFLLNGANLGAEDIASPYSVSWNTTTVANGTYTLTARARDAAGNTTTSAGVIVTVNNDTQAPTVSITAPAAGNVSGTINVNANASDNVSVVGVQFLLNGANLGAEDIASPYSVSWNTTTVANGTYTLTARARDAAGNTTTSAGVVVTVNNDLTVPTVNITAPASGNVSGTINVSAAASDNVGVVGVQFMIDGANIGSEDLTSPYSISWNTTGATNGNHSLTARARDAAGNNAYSNPVTITIANVSNNLIEALSFNEGTGTNAADVSGNNHNGTLSGATWVAGKYGQGANFNGTSNYVSIADHTDFTMNPAQNYTWSAWVKNTNFSQWGTVWSQTIDVNNYFYFYAHSSTDAEAGPVTNGVSVYWYNGSNKLVIHSNNNVLTAGAWSYITVTYNGSLAQASRFTIYVNGTDVTNRSDVVSAGTLGTLDPTNIRIGANQPWGDYLNAAIDEVRCYSRLLTVAEIQTDMNTPIGNDATAPTVNITAPAAGNVSGTINVTANASDNVGVSGVQFLLDGSNLGAEDVSSPYSVSWNTTTANNGNHTLTARARDAAGNTTTSAGITVTVNNVVDTQSPTVTITSPPAGNVSGIINVDANASDNVGVIGVQFLLDGSNLGTEDQSSPYSVSWNTATAANGNHTLTARARDAAGNTTTSAGVTVTVNNFVDTQSPTVSITSPPAGNVSGVINVDASASDNVGVAGVQFLIDGANLGAEDVTSPYSVSWNSNTATNGNHSLTARARDAAGNSATATIVNITVTNSNPPTISGINVSSITENSAVINWTTNIPTSSLVNYGTNTSYGFSTLVDPALVTSHSQILRSLNPGTLYHYQIVSGDVNGSTATSTDNTFTSASLASSLGTLNTHTVLAYPSGKLVPWTANPSYAYDSVMKLAWNYLLNSVPNDPSTGKPAYYSRSYLNPNTQQVVNWDHNPAGLYAMLTESALKYYAYSGNANVMQLAINVATWHLDHGMTTSSDSWPGVPYSEGPYGSLNYGGANQADGVGNLEPDKIGELGYAWLQLYKYNGNTRFRDAAIKAADVLSNKVRVGTMTQSPWPFRVKASNGAIIEDYGTDIIGPVSLFDGLIAAALGDTATYHAARNKAWTWMMTYPMQNNIWTQYFEDVSVQQSYNSNLNQYNANMVARYLLEHPEFDPSWETHVRGIITWVENTFGQTQNGFGATIIQEQTPVFPWVCGSHTSRYASVNALLYEKTGDLVAKEKAYRSFNWATYMARTNGVVIDGLLYGSESNANQWFTDGYGDYIRHFMTGLGAVPEWSPSNQTHLLRSTSVIKNISYGTGTISYTSYDAKAVDVLHVNFNPATVTVDGVALPQRTDLTQPGWTLDVATKTLKIYHSSGTQINISSTAQPIP